MDERKTRIVAAVLTASDSRKPANDISGDILAKLLTEFGAEVAERTIVKDDPGSIRDTLVRLADDVGVDLILTTGGTGLSPRDNTPEATLAVIEREAPGIAEAIRAGSMKKTSTAMLSRAVAGIRGRTLVINFPGSPKAVAECFEIVRPVLGHAINLISGDSSHDP